MLRNKEPKSSSDGRGMKIHDQCEQWQRSSKDWDHDCATVGSYYSGRKSETEEDEDTLGLVHHSNYLIGRDQILKAKDEELAFFEAPRNLMNFRLKQFNGSPREKKRQEQRFTKIVDRAVRELDDTFMYEVAQLADRKAVHGDAVIGWPPEGEDWRPFCAKILTEKDAPQNPYSDNFMRWAMYSTIEMSEVLEGVANKQQGWTKQAKKFLKAYYKKVSKQTKEGGTTFDQVLVMIRNQSKEELSSSGNSDVWDFYSSTLKVFYFYEKDFSKADEGKVPVNLSIVSRVEFLESKEDDKPALPDPLLFQHEGAFDDVQHAIHSFVQDSNLGVADPTWHTIKGLGHLNYEADRMVNILTSAMVNSSIDRNTPLFQMGSDGSDPKEIQEFIRDGYQAYSMIPSGIEFADKSKMGMSIGDSISAIQNLQSIAARNSTPHTGQSDTPKDELRINAARRHQQELKVANNRGRQNSRMVARFVRELGRRICEDLKDESFKGRARRQIDAIKSECDQDRVQWEYFFPENVEITYTRLTGDGDPELRRQIASERMKNIGVYSPEKRKEVLIEWSVSLDGDWEKAEQDFEGDGSPSADQQAIALDKMATMMTLGIPTPITVEDVPESQVPVMIQYLQMLVQQGEQRGAFTPEEDKGVITIGQHSLQLIDLIKEQGATQVAQVFETDLQRVLTEAQGPSNNLQAQQEAQNDPAQEKEMRELELKERNQQLNEAKFEVDVQKSVARQGGQDRRAQFNEYQQNSRLALERTKAEHKEEMDKAAIDLKRQQDQQKQGDK